MLLSEGPFGSLWVPLSVKLGAGVHCAQGPYEANSNLKRQ